MRTVETLSVIYIFLMACSDAFTAVPPIAGRGILHHMTASDSDVDLGLTPELERMTQAFRSISDEQLRYKQLLFMAQHTEEVNNMPDSAKVPENKVPGCLSNVYVDGSAKYNENKGDYVVEFIGDSDSLLTRGLVALLVQSLSGNTAADIQKVDPRFIKLAKIEQSLTPGRNNGFLNMLALMKAKSLEWDAAARAQGSEGTSKADTNESESEMESGDASEGPMHKAIVAALATLNPTSLELVNRSEDHMGHAGYDSENGESHFELEIVSDEFAGLNLVKRHQLIYGKLGEVMPKIHALQIRAWTTEEVGQLS